jgi:hypothetical protein
VLACTRGDAVLAEFQTRKIAFSGLAFVLRKPAVLARALGLGVLGCLPLAAWMFMVFGGFEGMSQGLMLAGFAGFAASGFIWFLAYVGAQVYSYRLILGPPPPAPKGWRRSPWLRIWRGQRSRSFYLLLPAFGGFAGAGAIAAVARDAAQPWPILAPVLVGGLALSVLFYVLVRTSLYGPASYADPLVLRGQSSAARRSWALTRRVAGPLAASWLVAGLVNAVLLWTPVVLIAGLVWRLGLARDISGLRHLMGGGPMALAAWPWPIWIIPATLAFCYFAGGVTVFVYSAIAANAYRSLAGEPPVA